MEETLKLILEKVSKIDAIEQELQELKQGQKNMDERLTGLEQGQKELKQGQSKLDAKIDGVNANVSDKIHAVDKKMNTRFDKLEKKVDGIQETVGDLVEFRIGAEGKLEKMK
jgi:chromosome segregation ATPase